MFDSSELIKLKEDIKKPIISDGDLKRVEIVILKYKSPEIEVDSVTNIIKYTEYPFKLNIFDTRKLSGNMSKLWNKVIKESTCDYVCIMDSDAFVKPNKEWGKDWLTEMMEVFGRHANVGVVAPVSGWGTTPAQSREQENIDEIEASEHMSGYCFLLRKEMLKDVGYFDEDFYIFGQDYDWFDRIKRSKWKMYYVPRAEVTHGYERSLGGSLSTRKAANEKEFIWKLDVLWAQTIAAHKKMARNGDKKYINRNYLEDEYLIEHVK